MGNRGFNVGGNKAGQAGGFVRSPFHRQFEACGGPQFQDSHRGGRRFDLHDLHVVGLTAQIDFKGITRDGKRCTLTLMGKVFGVMKPSLDRGTVC
jgi:hypothetical protein